MIDTHLHILPGVDDGPQTMEEMLALARLLVEEGVRCAVATPHYNDEFPQRAASEIRARVYEAQRVLDQHGIALRLLAGHEALLKPGLVEDVISGRLATLNGSRYLLLELWNSTWLPETERVIFELQAAGFVPLLAHVERYRAIQQDPNRLATIIQRGILAQVTAGSLIGMQGRSAQRCAETLLKRGLVHCIASDAHGLHTRVPCILRGLKAARRLVDDTRVYSLVETWPAAIVQNETCVFSAVGR